MPASTTEQAAIAATNFIGVMESPVTWVIGIFLGMLLIEMLFEWIGHKWYGDDDGTSYDEHGWRMEGGMYRRPPTHE